MEVIGTDINHATWDMWNVTKVTRNAVNVFLIKSINNNNI